MNKTGPYTIDELVEATGFDKRTIAYYVQEGLLPKIGRRGRLTRYPRSFADRLMVIKRLREAEESGERPIPMTLAEIRGIFERIPSAELSAIAIGALPIDLIDQLAEPQEDDFNGIVPRILQKRLPHDMEDTPDMAPRKERMNMMLEETGDPDLFVQSSRSYSRDSGEQVDACSGPPPKYLERSMPRFSSTADGVPRLSRYPGPEDEPADLLQLLRQLRRITSRSHRRPGRSEQWTNATITPGLSLSGRELDEQGRKLLERAAQLLEKEINRDRE